MIDDPRPIPADDDTEGHGSLGYGADAEATEGQDDVVGHVQPRELDPLDR